MSVALNFQQTGNLDAPAVVLLGSLGSDLSMWQPQIHALSNRYRVIAVDHRGHGKSPVPAGPYSIADLAGDVIALLDSLELESVHLVGLSLGGAVSQWIAAHHPTRVETLTLMCTSSQFAPAQPWIDRARAVRADGIASIAGRRRRTLVHAGSGRQRSGTSCPPRRNGRSHTRRGLCRLLRGAFGMDGRADLARIVAPTLLIAGEQDPATPPATLSAIADGIADAVLHVVDPGAHLASVEQAGRVTKLLATHIASHTSALAQRSAAVSAGMTIRRQVLGDAHVDRSIAGATEFTAPFQDFITRTAWGDIWSRPGLDHHTRRLLTLAILTAVGNEHELDMHIRAALRAGIDPDELVEVFLHTAVYAGVPNSNLAFALGKQALADLSAEPEENETT